MSRRKTAGRVSPQQKRTRREEEDTTTDEDDESLGGSYESIKLPGETWQNKALARQLKIWLRANASFRNRSYSREYIHKFIEAAQISSRFTAQEDQDRAFDEVMSIFIEFPSSLITRKFPEYSDQNILQILTELNVPYWFNRILFLNSKTYNLNNIPKEIQAEREFLATNQDSLLNTFAHCLVKLINRNPNDGLYLLDQCLKEPLWFASIQETFIKTFDEPNKAGDTPFDLIRDKRIGFLIKQEFQNASKSTISVELEKGVRTRGEGFILPKLLEPSKQEFSQQVEAFKKLSL